MARWGGARRGWWRWGRVALIVGRVAGRRPAGFISTGLATHPTCPKVGDVVEEVATISGAYEVGKFGMVVREAAGDSGLLVRCGVARVQVGAPYTGLGLSNYGKVRPGQAQDPQVYFFNSSTPLPGGDITSACGPEPAPCPARWPGEGDPRWAEELSRHEEGSMFGSSLASRQGEQVEGGVG